jgi:hypothetical protein
MCQLSIFQALIVTSKIIYYEDLNIHEKINLRSNTCGFGKIYYSNKAVRYYQNLANKYLFPKCCLSNSYYEHYRLNFNRSLETLNFIKNRNLFII